MSRLADLFRPTRRPRRCPGRRLSLEALEDRCLLSADLLASVLDPVSFQTAAQSMWGPSGPSVIDTGKLFAGTAWDYAINPTLGSEAANNFIALDAATRGKVGVDFQAILDPGSVDVRYAAQAGLDVVAGTGDTFTIHSTAVGNPTGNLMTRSPNIDVESNFIFELAASLAIRGEIGTPDITITIPTLTFVNQCTPTFFGPVCIPVPVVGSKEVTIPGITLAAFDQSLLSLDVAGTQQLLKLTNDPANPEFSILGLELASAPPGENLSLTFDLAFDPTLPPFFDVTAVTDSDPQKPSKEHSTNPFDVDVAFSMGDITIEAPTLFLDQSTFSEENGVAGLRASGETNLARIDLDADFLASVLFGLPPLGGSAGLTFSGIEVFGLSYDLLDVDVGPQFSVSQEFEFVPEPWVTLSFSKPVVIGGQMVQQHSMPVGSSLDVAFAGASAGEALDVQTSYFLNNQFRNSTNLLVAPQVDLLALAASVTTFLGTLFDEALIDPPPFTGPAVKLATIFEDTYTLGGFNTVAGQSLHLDFNEPPIINPENLALSMATVDEGSPATLSGTFTDPNAGQVHTVVIDWGDGTILTTIELGEGVHEFGPVPHTYADDAATPYAIAVTVTDGPGESDDAAAAVTVVNVPPTLILGGASAVDEGALYTLNLSSSDPGDDRIDHWTINWGDGHVQAVAGDPSAVTHTYADGLAGYTITATATDEDGTFAAGPHSVTVNNVAPTVGFTGSGLNLDASGQPIAFSGVRGQTLHFTGTLSDPGFDNPAASPATQETFTHVIDWGDGTSTGVQSAAVHQAGSPGVPTAGSFAASHVYASDGTYTVTVTVTDDDSGETVLTETVTIAAAAMQESGNLAAGGTTGPDDLRFVPGAGSGEIEVQLNGASLGTYSPTGVLLAFGQAGDDDIQVAGSIGLPAWLYGGGGKDRLKGGAGHDVLSGGAEDDLLLGGGGRDLLLGGTGADRLIGNADDDILIAGFTTYDDQVAAISALIAEWTSDNDYATRVSNLRTSFLKTEGDGATVFDDGAADVLTGSSGQDWFFANLNPEDPEDVRDRITDLSDDVFAGDLDFILS
jgi:Ca2+-binding RTX toxin-like protein